MNKVIKNLAAVSMVAMFSQVSIADDANTYPGSFGVKWAGQGNIIYQYSAIGNSSTAGPMYVDLPVINSDNKPISVSNVRVIDRSSSDSVNCSLHHVSSNQNGGFTGWWSGQKSSSGNSNLVRVLHTGSLSGFGQWMHSYFSCKIPAKQGDRPSQIVSYFVKES